MDNKCKGCYDTIHGCIVIYSKIDTCPCRKCLIKGVCQDDCNKFVSNQVGISEGTHYDSK
jgi:hypothetical protein